MRKHHYEKLHYEIVSARTYYGQHATGIVVLRNGHPELHGKRKDLKSSKIYKDALAYELKEVS